MNPNILGLILSYVFIFAIVGISTLLQSRKLLSVEGARKFVHIGVSNWWIIAMLTFDNFIFAIIPPITFIILNYANYRLKLVKVMDNEKRSDLGTVYFPISLLILAILSWGVAPFNATPLGYFGAFGILVMGYGDGFAAVIGEKFGKTKLVFGKSLEGSLAMFVASLIVASILLLVVGGQPLWWLIALVVALVATLVELYSPFGLDNLSVPIVVSFTYFLFTLI
jgi:phytol kinase